MASNFKSIPKRIHQGKVINDHSYEENNKYNSCYTFEGNARDSPYLEADSKRPKFEDILKNSSVFAVTQIAYAQNKRKCWWVMILTFAFIGCSYQVFRFVELYTQYPVTYSLDINQPNNLDFPAVTVCNMNRFRKKFKKCVTDFKHFDRCIQGILSESPIDLSSSKKPIIVTIGGAKVMSERRIKSICSHRNSAPSFKNILSSYARLNSSQREVIGHQLLDFITNCFFNGRECSAENIKVVPNLRYGNCFTFDFNNTMKHSSVASNTIPLNRGLELVLNLDVLSYIFATESVGSVVVIHDLKEDPNPEENGIGIKPGFETSLDLSPFRMLRLQHPYKDKCRDYAASIDSRFVSQKSCVKWCIQKFNLEKCGCTDSSLSTIAESQDCDLMNVTQMCCLDNSLDGFTNAEAVCGCSLPCVSTSYHTYISSTIWPSKSFFNRNQPGIPLMSGWNLIKYRKNHAKLKVFYSTLPVRTFAQNPKFQDSELLSHLGGEFGLWLGLSMFALFELCEMLYSLCKYVNPFHRK